jgi:hypothetical protein
MRVHERGEPRGRTRRAFAIAGWLLASALPVAAQDRSSEDDLAVVKRGVQSARHEPRKVEAASEHGASRAGSRPLWLKVRVVEKGAKRAKVTVNLPLAMVRALGDDFPVDLGSRRLRLSEILQTLEACGEPLVQVDDEQTSVRVWVE